MLTIANEVRIAEGNGSRQWAVGSGQPLDSPALEVLLQFAEPKVRGWLRYKYSATLSVEDIEDIWAEVRIAVLSFKLPEEACDWHPFFINYLKQVTWRVYRRYCARNPVHLSLDAIPFDAIPHPDEPEMRLDMDLVRCITEELLQMPTLHAAALVLHLDADLADEILTQGGTALIQHLQLPEPVLRAVCQQSPLPDAGIAQLYGTHGRAVIRARQHARERLRKRVQID